MVEWVNRVGMLLEFLSFWFAAPEILGEERLRALERKLEHWIERNLAEFLLVSVLISVGTLMWWLIPEWMFHFEYESWEFQETLAKTALEAMRAFGWLFLTQVLGFVLGMALLLILTAAHRPWLLVVLVLALATTVSVLALTGWTNARVWRTLSLAWVIGLVPLFMAMVDVMVAPLLQRLADDSHIRRRSLVVGAAMFMVGMVLQLIATFRVVL
jgi:hypothetical protein